MFFFCPPITLRAETIEQSSDGEIAKSDVINDLTGQSRFLLCKQ